MNAVLEYFWKLKNSSSYVYFMNSLSDLYFRCLNIIWKNLSLYYTVLLVAVSEHLTFHLSKCIQGLLFYFRYVTCFRDFLLFQLVKYKHSLNFQCLKSSLGFTDLTVLYKMIFILSCLEVEAFCLDYTQCDGYYSPSCYLCSLHILSSTVQLICKEINSGRLKITSKPKGCTNEICLRD